MDYPLLLSQSIPYIIIHQLFGNSALIKLNLTWFEIDFIFQILNLRFFKLNLNFHFVVLFDILIKIHILRG